MRSHFVDDLVYDQQGVDSDDEIHQNPDNVDSNDENNPDNDYPDEEDEEEGGYYGKRKNSDPYESDFGDYDNDDDEDGEDYGSDSDDYESRCKKERQEQKFSSNFYR